jgi:hypothetical protein
MNDTFPAHLHATLCTQGPNDVGLSRKHIIEGMAKSLNRLQLAYVDIVVSLSNLSRTYSSSFALMVVAVVHIRTYGVGR